MNKTNREDCIVNDLEELSDIDVIYNEGYVTRIESTEFEDYRDKDLTTRIYEVIEKVEKYGIYSLYNWERTTYKYHLTINSYVKKKNGDLLKPIHINIAELVLLDFIEIFVLFQDVYIYDDTYGYYKKDVGGKQIKEHIRNHLDREFIEDKIVNSIYNLILNTLSIQKSYTELNNRPKKWINFKNGYYSYLEDKFYSHNPKYYETGCIKMDWSFSLYPSTYKYVTKNKGTILEEVVEEPLEFIKFLDNSVPHYESQNMLGQYIGVALTLDTSHQRFLMICGQGGTGKSVLLNLIESIIGSENTSHISLQGLQEQFTLSGLFLKQANICADLPLTALNEVDKIKQISGNDKVYADRKFKEPLEFKPYARLFFSCNGIPLNTSDKSNALYRRMLILHMDKKPKSIDMNLLDKLKEEKGNIISWVIEALQSSYGEIDESTESKKLVKEAQKDSDTVEAFIEDRCIIDKKYRVCRTTLYDSYKLYCDKECRKYVSSREFFKALELKGYKQVRGTTRDFIGIKLNKEILLSNNNLNVIKNSSLYTS